MERCLSSGARDVNLQSTLTSEMRGDEHNSTRLKKKFNFMTAVGIALCCSGAWEGWIASLAQGLNAGGPVTLIWGWIFVSIGITFMATSLAEMVSMWPSAGGQYVWTAHLAPQPWSRLLSWYTAFLSLTGAWLGMISCAMGVAVQVQSYVAIARDYNPKQWHALLIAYACLAIWLLVNIFSTQILHRLNTFVIYIHFTFFFVVIGVLAGCTKDKHNTSYVFTRFENNTGWSSDGVTWCIGLLPALYAFFSLDATTHYCEEIDHAEIAVPRALFLQGALNGTMTLPFIVTVLYCMGEPSEVLTSTIGLMSPFTQIVYNSTGKAAVSILLNAVSSTVAFTAGLDLWGGAGRAVWSLARDGGLPPRFAQLSPRFGVPVWALLVLGPPSIPIVLIYNWNTTAFYGIMSGVLVSFQLSYVIPIALSLFYARWHKKEKRGPFNMGRCGLAVDVVAFAFGVFMVVFMSFPVYQPVTAANMNYACAIVGTALLVATISWFSYGRQHYNGPLETLHGSRVGGDALEPGISVLPKQ